MAVHAKWAFSDELLPMGNSVVKKFEKFFQNK